MTSSTMSHRHKMIHKRWLRMTRNVAKSRPLDSYELIADYKQASEYLRQHFLLESTWRSCSLDVILEVDNEDDEYDQNGDQSNLSSQTGLSKRTANTRLLSLASLASSPSSCSSSSSSSSPLLLQSLNSSLLFNNSCCEEDSNDAVALCDAHHSSPLSSAHEDDWGFFPLDDNNNNMSNRNSHELSTNTPFLRANA